MKTMKTKHKLDFLAECYPEAITADGLDDAIMGFCAASGTVVYDYDKCLKIFMERDSMDIHDAQEYMEFNVVGAYVGELTPIFIHTL
jgi:hypothetical protein|tara:strand:+ start:5368 stop:5628 length:261 start_codon:yes stop_codon:yes gene_type:complete